MKRIIDGKRYNTETATVLGSNSGGNGASDFHHFTESLYVTKKGTFFLAGKGGPLSRWSEPTPWDRNGRQGGSGIQVLDSDEARAWAERNCDAATVEEHFQIEEG